MSFVRHHWPFWGLMLLFFVAQVVLYALPVPLANASATPVLALLTVATSGSLAIYIMRVYRDYLSRKNIGDE